MSDVRKCMKFPVVALHGVRYMPAPSEKESARVFYVVAARPTQRSVVGVGQNSVFGDKLNAALNIGERSYAKIAHANTLRSNKTINF